MAAVPSAANLSWKPRDPRVAAEVPREQFIDLCLGTSMMMAFLQAGNIISHKIADKQVRVTLLNQPRECRDLV